MDGGAWLAIVHGVEKGLDMTEGTGHAQACTQASSSGLTGGCAIMNTVYSFFFPCRVLRFTYTKLWDQRNN